RTPLGFDPTNILTLQLEIPEWRYRNGASITAYYDRLLTRIAGLPGVGAVAAIDRLPVLGGEQVRNLVIEGYASARPDEKPWAVTAPATESFSAASRIPIVTGRGFTAEDNENAQPVAIVSRAMADRFLGGADRAVGTRVAFDEAADVRRWLVV